MRLLHVKSADDKYDGMEGDGVDPVSIVPEAVVKRIDLASESTDVQTMTLLYQGPDEGFQQVYDAIAVWVNGVLERVEKERAEYRQALEMLVGVCDAFDASIMAYEVAKEIQLPRLAMEVMAEARQKQQGESGDEMVVCPSCATVSPLKDCSMTNVACPSCGETSPLSDCVTGEAEAAPTPGTVPAIEVVPKTKQAPGATVATPTPKAKVWLEELGIKCDSADALVPSKDGAMRVMSELAKQRSGGDIPFIEGNPSDD